jgi:hypothetical protein
MGFRHAQRHAVGYARYDTPAELKILNELYELLRLERNFFSPQQKLISKTREGAKVIKRYDTARTPFQRISGRTDIDRSVQDTLGALYATLNPAQLRRDIAALQDRLIALAAAKGHPGRLPTPPPTRAQSHEATKTATRAS